MSQAKARTVNPCTKFWRLLYKLLFFPLLNFFPIRFIIYMYIKLSISTTNSTTIPTKNYLLVLEKVLILKCFNILFSWNHLIKSLQNLNHKYVTSDVYYVVRSAKTDIYFFMHYNHSYDATNDFDYIIYQNSSYIWFLDGNIFTVSFQMRFVSVRYQQNIWQIFGLLRSVSALFFFKKQILYSKGQPACDWMSTCLRSKLLRSKCLFSKQSPPGFSTEKDEREVENQPIGLVLSYTLKLLHNVEELPNPCWYSVFVHNLLSARLCSVNINNNPHYSQE